MRGTVCIGLAIASAAALACGGEEVRSGENVRTMMAGAARPEGAENLPPEIRSVALRPSRPVSGEPIRAEVDASDPNGDPVSLGFAWTVNGRAVGGNQPTLELSRAKKEDLVSVRVTASDGHRESPPFEVAARVYNRPPRLRGIQIEPADNITTGGRITVTPSAEDPDGDPVEYEYRWSVNGSVVDEEGPSLETRPLRRGDTVQVRVRASDGEDDSDPIDSPVMNVVNAAPQIVSRPEPAAEGGFRYKVAVEDPDGDRTLRFKLTRAPKGMSVDSLSGRIEWIPAADQSGTFPVEVVVEDGRGGRAVQHFELTVGQNGDGGQTPASPGAN